MSTGMIRCKAELGVDLQPAKPVILDTAPDLVEGTGPVGIDRRKRDHLRPVIGIARQLRQFVMLRTDVPVDRPCHRRMSIGNTTKRVLRG